MRISEIYLSIEGEGPRVGIPTVFVRFAGCNLRCPSWPCDTPHAIFPELYRNEWETLTPQEVFARIRDTAEGREYFNVCFTGGEPFLQPRKDMEELIELIIRQIDPKPPCALECFSNGTLPYSPKELNNVSFIMDWKLPGSGEKYANETRIENFAKLGYKDAVKFTISSREDYEVAQDIWKTFAGVNSRPKWYYGVVWDKIENDRLIGWVLRDQLPWIHTMQVHNIIWDRTKRGI